MLGKNGVQDHDTTKQQASSCSHVAVFCSFLLGSKDVETVEIRAEKKHWCRNDAKDITGKEGEKDCSAGPRLQTPKSSCGSHSENFKGQEG